jgi:hypothetical protein
VKLEFSRQISWKKKIKYESPSISVQCEPSCSPRADGRMGGLTKMEQLIATFSNFVNAPQNKKKPLQCARDQVHSCGGWDNISQLRPAQDRVGLGSTASKDAVMWRSPDFCEFSNFSSSDSSISMSRQVTGLQKDQI